MDVELITIGTELLLGFTIDTNAADLARALAPVGARVVRKTVVADDPGAIRDAVAAALARTRFVITTGGLGPTSDDMTKQAVAELYDAPLVTDDGYLARLEERWRRLGRSGPMPAANRSQALVPAGATVLPNPRGTAPGLWLEDARGVAVLLPGVPHEMRALAEREVASRIARRTGGRATTSRVLRTTGIAESALADRIGPVEAQLGPATLAYLPSFAGVDLRVTVWNLLPDEGDGVLRRAAELLRPLLVPWYYGEGTTDLAAVVLERARATGARLATAESCTGGLVAGRLTAIPGASATYVGGVVAYDNDVKVRQLGVPPDVLAQQGAVSEPVVLAMADGVRERLGADLAVAISGVAGPDGGTPDKPVGTVWLGASWADARRAIRLGLPGDRDEIRARAAQAALDLLRRMLERPTGPAGGLH
jgi:nicotinamide-nucleotide amidase